MKISRSPAIWFTALLLLAGCSRVTESDLVGNWTSLTETEIADDAGAAEQVMDVVKRATAPMLELREDNSFTLTILVPIKGSWQLKKGQVILEPETYSGFDASNMLNADKQIVLDIADDGKMLTGKVSSGSLAGSLSFSKVEG